MAENIKDKLDELVYCPVCYLPYDLPKLLICNHTVCYSCIRKLKTGTTVKCPICRHPNHIPRGGVKHFKNNMTMLDVLDMVKPPERKEIEVVSSDDEDDDVDNNPYSDEDPYYFVENGMESPYDFYGGDEIYTDLPPMRARPTDDSDYPYVNVEGSSLRGQNQDEEEELYANLFDLLGPARGVNVSRSATFNSGDYYMSFATPDGLRSIGADRNRTVTYDDEESIYDEVNYRGRTESDSNETSDDNDTDVETGNASNSTQESHTPTQSVVEPRSNTQTESSPSNQNISPAASSHSNASTPGEMLQQHRQRLRLVGMPQERSDDQSTGNLTRFQNELISIVSSHAVRSKHPGTVSSPTTNVPPGDSVPVTQTSGTNSQTSSSRPVNSRLNRSTSSTTGQSNTTQVDNRSPNAARVTPRDSNQQRNSKSVPARATISNAGQASQHPVSRQATSQVEEGADLFRSVRLRLRRTHVDLDQESTT